MTVYNVIYTRTNSHNFVTEVQVKGTFADYDKAIERFNSIKTQIVANDPNYEIAEEDFCKKSIDNLLLCFWVDDTDNYYEVNLRIISSTIEN